KRFRVKLGKCLREGASRLVGCNKLLHRIGGAQQFPRLLYERLDALIESAATHGPHRRGSVLIDQLAQFFSRWKCDLVDLVEIVIFAGNPKDRDMRSPG